MDLRSAVKTRARVDGDLILVDDFLNHRVEPDIMLAIGKALAEAYAGQSPGLVLTAEASGIAPAMSCASELRVPMVFAKKFLGTGNRYSFFREVASPTKGIEYRVEVARRVITPGSRVLVVDDFLAGGRTAEALGEIAEEAGCEVVGLGFVIEKAYQDGRARLERHGWPVVSLVEVESISGGSLVLR